MIELPTGQTMVVKLLAARGSGRWADGRAAIGFDAPESVRILREELADDPPPAVWGGSDNGRTEP